MGRVREDDIRSDLEKLPTGSEAYDQAYEEAMKRIRQQGTDGKKLAEQVLAWITYGKRPLHVVELQHALAVEGHRLSLKETRIPHVQDMVSVCCGLVTVDEESNIIRLVHYTTQEYFQRTQQDLFPHAEAEITMICCTYLSFSVFETGYCQTNNEFEHRLKVNPLYNYAAHHWGHHARRALTLSQEVIDFLEHKLKVEAASQALMAVKRWNSNLYDSQRFPKHMLGIHLVAYFGAQNPMKAILGSQHPDSKDDDGQTPLSRAAEAGHEAVVKLLLETGQVEVDSKDRYGQTPLWWAVQAGHEAVVKLLLETGQVEVDSKDDVFGQTPLSRAAQAGHEAVVKLLLETGQVEVDSKDRYGQTPLWWAARAGHEAVVKLLLETGQVEVDSKDDVFGQTPLSWAANSGHEAVVKLLQLHIK
jgi:ankyrin repeat protein